MRFPVERRRTAPLRGAWIVDPGRLLQADPHSVVVAQELEQFDQAGTIAPKQKPSKFVMAGLVPAIHVFGAKKAWMAGINPAMTNFSVMPTAPAGSAPARSVPVPVRAGRYRVRRR